MSAASDSDQAIVAALALVYIEGVTFWIASTALFRLFQGLKQ